MSGFPPQHRGVERRLYVTWEEAVNMGLNMGGGCGMCPPPCNYSADQGGRHSSKFDGGLNMGARGAWGELKMLSKNNCEGV